MGKNRDFSKFPNAITVLDNGNVGIGTSTPTSIGAYRSLTMNGVDGCIIDLDFNGSDNGRIYTSSEAAIGIESLSTTRPLAFKTQNGSGSIERMTITPAGNIGINNTSPTGRLHINSNDTPTISGTTPTGAFVIQSTASTALTMGVFENNPFYGWMQMRHGNLANTTYGLVIQPLGGNVGIGTTSPDRLLHLAATQGTLKIQSTSTSGANAPALTFFHAGNDEFVINGGDGLRFLSSGVNERMRITGGGNLYIGTTTGDGYKLQISGNTQAQATFSQTYIGVAAYSQWVNSSGSFVMGLDGASGTTQRFHITSAGNVGIATSGPAFRLDVSEAGSVINGTATVGSNMKGIRIYNSNTATNNNAVGLWFSTGPHQAGIASFRATADSTWETSLAFYTHVNNTSNLNDATEKMRISGEGYITMPSQPSFMAAGNSGSISVSGGNVLIFNANRYNTGGHFNNGNGRFTAPVAGKYLFSWNIYHFGGYVTGMVLTINGSQYAPADVVPYTYRSSSDPEGTTGCTVQLDLSANDYVEVRVRAGFGAAQIYMSHSYFTGHLLS